MLAVTKTDYLVERIAKNIAIGRLAPGDKLLSIRAAAQEFEVSKNTVIDAYDRLVARHPPNRRAFARTAT